MVMNVPLPCLLNGLDPMMWQSPVSENTFELLLSSEFVLNIIQVSKKLHVKVMDDGGWKN